MTTVERSGEGFRRDAGCCAGKLMKKTKIVCTLGPASESEEVMEQMLRAGMNVARFNFSHGDHPEHKERLDRFRRVRDRLGLPAAVLLDTKGPEIRLENLKGGKAQLERGAAFTLTTETIEGDGTIASITYPRLPLLLKEGDRVLIDDGKIQLKVRECTEKEIRCTVVHGGQISNHKGINVPNVHLDMPYLSKKDKADLLFAVENDMDYIAASFVRTKQDVIDMRNFLDYYGGQRIKIIAKIENVEGVNNFDEILRHADGIMIARGDMGVEVEYERLPGLQKRFIRKCYQSGKMVITATQMLESMIHNINPTRAEITDVANAVFDGTSAIMLSGESAAGEYPVEAVQAMAKIARQAEADAFAMNIYVGLSHEIDASDITNAICDATCTTARDVNAKAIIAVTKYGHTARCMSQYRPIEPVVAATPDVKTFHQLSLSWGVYPVVARNQHTIEALFEHAIVCAKQLDMVKEGDRVVITGGIPLDMEGTTNTLKVQTVK